MWVIANTKKGGGGFPILQPVTRFSDTIVFHKSKYQERIPVLVSFYHQGDPSYKNNDLLVTVKIFKLSTDTQNKKLSSLFFYPYI